MSTGPIKEIEFITGKTHTLLVPKNFTTIVIGRSPITAGIKFPPNTSEIWAADDEFDFLSRAAILLTLYPDGNLGFEALTNTNNSTIYISDTKTQIAMVQNIGYVIPRRMMIHRIYLTISNDENLRRVSFRAVANPLSFAVRLWI